MLRECLERLGTVDVGEEGVAEGGGGEHTVVKALPDATFQQVKGSQGLKLDALHFMCCFFCQTRGRLAIILTLFPGPKMRVHPVPSDAGLHQQM